MLPVWNCAYPLTANSERHSAAATTARNLRVGHRFIEAPFIDGIPTVQDVGPTCHACDLQFNQRVTRLRGSARATSDSILRSLAFRLLNVTERKECVGAYQIFFGRQ